MPGKHARLSPSAAERWVSCPASIRMEKLVPRKPDSPYAQEGTNAHALAELKAQLAFGMITDRVFKARYAKWLAETGVSPEIAMEMEEYTDAYVALLRERMALYPDSTLLLEQRVNTGVPSSWGTADAVIFSPVHVEIVDFKYGQGVAVQAHGNPQLRLYGCGALDTFGDVLGDTEVVRVTVHQPRLSHVLTEELTADALREWRAEVIMPRALLALSDNAPFGPSAEACRWCEASGRCRVQMESATALDFGADPELLSPVELAAAIGQAEEVSVWVKAVNDVALDTAYSQGTPIPGYKVVLSGGQRKVLDEAALIVKLGAEGYERDQYLNTKAKGIGDLEKLLGKPRFAELLEAPGIVAKTEGKPALVHETDSRSSITPNAEAVRVFDDEDTSSNLI